MSQPCSAGIRTYQGSCRCGAIRFEADMDLSSGTNRCNCTICTKTGWWSFLVQPDAFRMASDQEPADPPQVSDVPSGGRCPTCRVVAFGHGDLPELGGEFYAVNVRCLDGVDLTGVPIHFLDGRHDTWALLAVGNYVDPFVGAGERPAEPAATGTIANP